MFRENDMCKYLYLLPLVLAGCAAAPVTSQEKAAYIAGLSNAELCYVQAAGFPAAQPFTTVEIEKRNLKCTPELMAMGETINRQRLAQSAAQQQADNAARPNALANFGRALSEMGAPRSGPPMVNCRTAPGPGGTSTTTCQ